MVLSFKTVSNKRKIKFELLDTFGTKKGARDTAIALRDRGALLRVKKVGRNKRGTLLFGLFIGNKKRLK